MKGKTKNNASATLPKKQTFLHIPMKTNLFSLHTYYKQKEEANFRGRGLREIEKIRHPIEIK